MKHSSKDLTMLWQEQVSHQAGVAGPDVSRCKHQAGRGFLELPWQEQGSYRRSPEAADRGVGANSMQTVTVCGCAGLLTIYWCGAVAALMFCRQAWPETCACYWQHLACLQGP